MPMFARRKSSPDSVDCARISDSDEVFVIVEAIMFERSCTAPNPPDTYGWKRNPVPSGTAPTRLSLRR